MLKDINMAILPGWNSMFFCEHSWSYSRAKLGEVAMFKVRLSWEDGTLQ